MTPKAQAFLDALTRLCEQHSIKVDVISYERVYLHTLAPGAAPLERDCWADATDDSGEEETSP